MSLDIEEVRRLIRTVQDPVELQKQLTEMVEEAHPVLPFEPAEEMLMHQFVDCFKKGFCEGNETRFWQWPVRIVMGKELLLALGTLRTLTPGPLPEGEGEER